MKPSEFWGEEALPRLNGMFAFLIWDARLRRMFVARDRFGEKPLFYAHLPDGGIVFASEMKALLRDPRIDAAIDEATLARYTERHLLRRRPGNAVCAHPASSGCHRDGGGRVRGNLPAMALLDA